MKKEQAKAEICRTKKDVGLSCNGCQYGEDCEEKQQKETADGIPADIKPGTKQAKIYGLLKDGQTAKEIIATKEFAPESVYIVARKHFPDAITPNGKNVERVKKTEDEQMKKALQIVEAYMKEEPKVDERIIKLEQMTRDGAILRKRCETAVTILRETKAALEDGKIIETYKKLQQVIEYLEGEKK